MTSYNKIEIKLYLKSGEPGLNPGLHSYYLMTYNKCVKNRDYEYKKFWHNSGYLIVTENIATVI